MTTYREERERIRLSFIENSIRKKLVDNASTKYDIDVPIQVTRPPNPDAYTLLYGTISRKGLLNECLLPLWFRLTHRSSSQGRS